MEQPKNGYKIDLDRTRHILKFRLWGIWDVPLAQQFEREIKSKILEMEQLAPQGWHTLVDLSEFPPQFEEVQDATKAVMQFELDHGMQKGATVLAKTMTKLQISRLARQVGEDPGSFFQSEDEAIRWLTQA